MDFVNAISSLAGYSTAYSNMTTQSSGLNASTVDKIKRMENLTNTSMTATSCFIGLNSPIMSGLSTAAYINKMAAILNEGTSVFTNNSSYTSNPVANSYVAPQENKTQNTEAKTETKAAPKAETKTTGFTPEQAKLTQQGSDTCAKRHQEVKAEHKEAQKKELMDLVKQVAEKKSSGTQGAGYFLNYANGRIAELEKSFTKEELRAIYNEIEKDAQPKYESTEKLPQNNGQNAAHKIQAEKIRAQYIENPRQGSKLAILRAQLESVEKIEKLGNYGRCAGYLPSKASLEQQIREIESGEMEAILEAQIQKLEEETKDYGETSWYNFTKNSKLKELESLKEQKANLF